MKLSFSLKNLHIPLAWLVGINLVLKLTTFFLIYHGQNLLGNKIANQDFDEMSYDFIAHQLTEHKTFAPLSDTAYTAAIGGAEHINRMHVLQIYHDSFRLPGYPLFMAGVYFIAGVKPYLVILLQILISLLYIVLIYRICLLASGNKTIASFAGLLYAIDIHSIYNSCLLLADTFATLAMLIALFYFVKFMTLQKNKYFLFSAVAMAFACSIRPVMLLYPAVLLFLYLIFNKEKFWQKIKMCAVYMLITSVFISIWSFRNHRVYGHWEPTTESGELLSMWSAAFSEARTSHQSIDTIRKAFLKQADSMNFDKTTNPFDKAAILQKVAYNYFGKHKLSMISSQFIGGLHMYLSIGNVDMGKSFGWETQDIRGYPDMSMQRISKNFSGTKETMLALLILMILCIEYVGALIGMIELYRRRNYALLLLCVLTILYFTAVTGVVGMYRYKLPVVPSIIILAGFGYYRLFNLKKNGNS